MEHNTNQNSNYLALLNLADDGTYTVTKIDDNVKIKFTKMDRLIFTNLDRII